MADGSLLDRARAIARDRDRGASELTAELLRLLSDALRESETATSGVVRIVCAGQPVMAPLWNACASAISELETPGSFARVRAEMERAPAALQRAAAAALGNALEDVASPQLLTLSFSGSVAAVLARLHTARPIQVVCGEGRPRFEGRRMAGVLSAAGVPVTLTTDAALTAFLDTAAAVVVGADAISHPWWINKVGTRGLTAAACAAGTPVYVIATRDKAFPESERHPFGWPDGDPAEVWTNAQAGVLVRNPTFEAIPVDCATLFLTDAGPIAPDQAAALSQRYASGFLRLRRALQ